MNDSQSPRRGLRALRENNAVRSGGRKVLAFLAIAPLILLGLGSLPVWTEVRGVIQGTTKFNEVQVGSLDAGNANFQGTQFSVAGAAYLSASDVNYVLIQNGGQGIPIRFQALGADSSVAISLEPKGSGGVILGAGSTKIGSTVECTPTVNFASTDTGNCLDDTQACSGAVAGSPCFVGVDAASVVTGSHFECFATTNSVTLRHCCSDTTGTTCNPPNATYRVRVLNP